VKSKGHRGFTLVEVLVVVAILATLAVLAYGMGTSLVNKARIAQSSANLKTLVIANASYESDNGEYCPAFDQSNLRRWHGRRSSGDAKFDPRKGLLAPYLGESQEVGICPLFRSMVISRETFESGTGGYGYNAVYIGGRPGGIYNKTTKLLIPARREMVEDPARTVMFATTAYAREGGLQDSAYCEPPFWDFGGGPGGDRPSPTVHFRADGKALVGWCDGHVSAEAKNGSAAGTNPHGGDAEAQNLGWFGPEENNGFWNTRKP